MLTSKKHQAIYQSLVMKLKTFEDSREQSLTRVLKHLAAAN